MKQELLAMRGRAADSLSAYREVKAIAETAIGFGRRHLQHTIKIRSDDPHYEAIATWVLGKIAPTRQRAALLRTRRDYEESARDGDARPRSTVALLYDGADEATIRLGSHRIRARVLNGGSEKVESLSDLLDRMTPALYDTLLLTCFSRAAREALVREIREVVRRADEQERPPAVYYAKSWGGFKRQDLPPRPISSVFLRAGQMERLVGDLATFLEAEATYNRLAVPWHRGYLLHGPPGTGKTSVVRALACHFGLDLYVVALGDMGKDNNLMEALSNVPPRSVLLLEDADVFSASRDRKKHEGQVSLSGLLNALDGVLTPHGLVTAVTTNHRDLLDPALTRAGRLDVEEELEPANGDTARRMFRHFYGVDPAETYELRGRTSADLAEVFKRHLDDPAAAIHELQAGKVWPPSAAVATAVKDAAG